MCIVICIVLLKLNDLEPYFIYFHYTLIKNDTKDKDIPEYKKNIGIILLK